MSAHMSLSHPPTKWFVISLGGVWNMRYCGHEEGVA